MACRRALIDLAGPAARRVHRRVQRTARRAAGAAARGGAGAVTTLALFDLDHTLIPFDSGMAWTRFLVERGALPPQAEEHYLGYCHQYVAGTLDIHAMHRASVGPLAAFEPAQLAG